MKSDHQIKSIVEGILSYLTEKKSLDLLPEISEELMKQSWVRFDPNLATVSSRVKLDQVQLKTLKSILSKNFKRPIRIKVLIDKSIIAGLKVSIAGEVIDGTVNKKLEELKKQVMYD